MYDADYRTNLSEKATNMKQLIARNSAKKSQQEQNGLGQYFRESAATIACRNVNKGLVNNTRQSRCKGRLIKTGSVQYLSHHSS